LQQATPLNPGSSDPHAIPETQSNEEFLRGLGTLSLEATAHVSDPILIAQFNALIQEVVSGQFQRHVFAPWELDVLLDIESCRVRQSSRIGLLRRYQQATCQRALRGGQPLLRFSDFLLEQRRRRSSRKAATAGLSSN
jgi:hypothetical protein